LKSDTEEIERGEEEAKIFIKEGWVAEKETINKNGDKVVKLKKKKSKEIKTQHEAVIQAVRKGEMDIANIGAEVEIPKIEKIPQMVRVDFQNSLDAVNFYKMKEDFPRQRTSAIEGIYLETMLWAREEFAPFMKDIVEELSARQDRKSDELVVFNITEEKGGNI
jgi:hypothetical protein